MSNCFNISPLVLADTFNTWFQRTNDIISTINDIEIAGINVYDHPSYNYFGQKIEQVNNSCYLTSEIITGPFINFIDGDSSTYGAGTSADPRKITLTFPNTSAFLADRQLTGNDELIINDGSVEGGIPVKRIKANNLVPSVIDVGYLRIQNRNQTSQGATFSFYSESSALNNVWSGISASSFSSERVGGFIPATGPISIGNNVFKPIIPVTDETTGLIPDSFVRLPLSFKLNDVTIQGFESPADVKFFDLSAGPGITMSESTGTDPTSGLVNSVSYTIEALIPDDGNDGPYGTNLFNINGYNSLLSSLSADSRSLLSANSGLSGGKGIKTNLINRDVSLPVTYIIPGDPNTVITYSGMTAVDIFTIEENPEDSNYVRKIGDIMTGTLTGTEASFTSLTASNGFIGTLTGNEASFTSLTASNGFIENFTTLNSTASNGFIGTLTGTEASFTSLTASDGFIGTLTGTEASFTNLTASDGFIENFTTLNSTASNGFIGTLTGNEASFTSLTAGTSFNFGPTSQAIFQDAHVSMTGNDSLMEINVATPSDRKKWDFVVGTLVNEEGSTNNVFGISTTSHPETPSIGTFNGNLRVGLLNYNEKAHLEVFGNISTKGSNKNDLMSVIGNPLYLGGITSSATDWNGAQGIALGYSLDNVSLRATNDVVFDRAHRNSNSDITLPKEFITLEYAETNLTTRSTSQIPLARSKAWRSSQISGLTDWDSNVPTLTKETMGFDFPAKLVIKWIQGVNENSDNGSNWYINEYILNGDTTIKIDPNLIITLGGFLSFQNELSELDTGTPNTIRIARSLGETNINGSRNTVCAIEVYPVS